MLGWKKHKLESKLPGEISVTSDMQMTPPLYLGALRGLLCSGLALLGLNHRGICGHRGRLRAQAVGHRQGRGGGDRDVLAGDLHCDVPEGHHEGAAVALGRTGGLSGLSPGPRGGALVRLFSRAGIV